MSRGEKAVGGLSALGGQCQSPYIKGGVIEGDLALGHSNPGGSSTGSAVGVAAGYSPLAFASEADGSINTPASRAALFALKCTPQTITPRRNILDLTDVRESRRNGQNRGGSCRAHQNHCLHHGHSTSAAGRTAHNLVRNHPRFRRSKIMATSIISVRARRGVFSPNGEPQSYEAAIDNIQNLGGHVHYPVPVVHPSNLQFESESGYITILRESKKPLHWKIDDKKLTKPTVGEIRDSVNHTLAALPPTPVQSLANIINFNNDHPDLQAGLGKEPSQ
ncbi:hypothetical protein XANCAGTX0491_009709 [Xanthoria calcicola]